MFSKRDLGDDMKVCFNTCSFSFDCPGGGEIQLLKTRSALEKLGVQVDLYNQWNPILSQFDLVHFFTVQQGMASFCEYVKSKNLPLILSPIFWPPKNALRGNMWEIEKMLHLADRILPNSQSEADLLSSMFDIDPKKFHIVYNAITPTDFQPADAELFRKKYSIETPFFLCVANVEPRKNQLMILESMREMGCSVPFVCVGNVRDEDYFNQCSQFSSFKYIGAMRHGEALLTSAYRAASLLILVSQFETPGLTVLEGLQFGCSALVTDRGATKEYFSNAVLYADPDSRESICKAIAAHLSGATLPPFNGSKYTWNYAAHQTLRAYEDVLL